MFSLSNTLIKPSRTLLFFFCGVHLLALVSISVLTIDWFAKLISYLIVVLIFALNFSERVLLTSPHSVEALTWNVEERSMYLRLKNDQVLYVLELRQRIITPFMVCLLVEVEGRYFPLPIVVFHDSSNEVEFRRLKVLAHYGKVRSEDL